MFSPSKSLLFTNLKIHHPLPLNPRESKQLLNLLTTSFRQHLDAEHPAFKTAAGPSTRLGKPAHHKHDARRKSLSESSRTPVDRHMQSMLTNPLFGYTSTQNTLENASKPSARTMRLFDMAVAKGMMNIDYAKNLLKENKRAITASSVLDVQEGLRKSEAGTKVLKWLMSSGAINNLNFSRDEAFTSILIEHLVAEDLQEVVWSWIKKSFERISSLSTLEDNLASQRRREIVTPLLQLVIAEANHFGSLDKAYMCLSRAAGYLHGVPARTMIQILYPPGRFLVNETIFTHSTRAVSSDSDFESFLSLLPVMFHSKNLRRYTAHLNLFHPTSPQTGPAMEIFRNLVDFPTSSPTQTREVVQLGLDTAKYLLENDRLNEALEVMDILRVNFPEQLGVSQKRQLDEVRAEASTMELLEGLSLA